MPVVRGFAIILYLEDDRIKVAIIDSTGSIKTKESLDVFEGYSSGTAYFSAKALADKSSLILTW